MTLLDTHVWLWWLSDPELLSEPASDAIESARSSATLAVSSISVWEMAMLVEKGRVELVMSPSDLLAHCERLPFLRFVPLTNPIALRSVELEPFHADLADRMIVATAVHHGAKLVTKDRRIHDFEEIVSIW